MPPGIGYGDGTTGLLEGLVGGFLMGHDFRTQRNDRQVSAAERLRRQQIEDEERRVAAGDRARTNAVQDYSLRTEHGVAFSPETGGMVNVGPSAAQREANRVAALRKGVGQSLVTQFGLGMSPSDAANLHEGDLLDDYLERTTPKTVEAPTTLSTGQGPVQWNNATGAWEPVMVGNERATLPGGAAGAAFGDLPVDQQRAVTVIGPALDTLDRYEAASRAYLARNPVSRGLGRVGVPGADRDRAIGELESLQSSLVLSVKELAGLGVLSAQDERIVLNLIGNPLSAGAVIRDPESVLAKIAEGRRFLEGKVAGIAQANPGLDFSGITRRATPGDFSNMSDEEILRLVMPQ